jgi:NADH dehydrogenase
VVVGPDLSLPGRPEVFVIGDLACCRHGREQPVPGLAPAAMQEGRHVAEVIAARLRGESLPPFRYRDPGSLATIGRSRAVAAIRGWRFSGFPAWLLWAFVHLFQIVELENRVLVFVQWAWNYFTRNRSARLITEVAGAALPPEQASQQAGSQADGRADGRADVREVH